MDILNPELIWIDNRCYRKIPIRGSEPKFEAEKPCIFNSREYKHEEEDYSDVPIKHEGKNFFATLCAPSLVGCVIGYGGKTLKILQQQTGASIKIPDRTGHIVITASAVGTVGDAYKRISDIIKAARLKKESTHFISFPMNQKEIQERFLKFKEDILSNCKRVRGVDESIFQKPEKLHLTVTTLVLLDPCDRENATAILQNYKNKILNVLDGKELVVQIKGIEYMNDDPAEVDVLYAKIKEVDDDTCLQIISNMLYEAFVEAGYSRKEYDYVKLHITLMNTLFRSGQKQKCSERETFNAIPLLEKYADYNFGQITISEIHVSIRHTIRSDGYYQSSSILKLS